jgi:hypothetical protein
LRLARLFGTDQLDELVEEAARLNSQPMCNVYIGAALRHPHTAPFGRAEDSDAYALTCGYVDLDDPGAATAAKDIYGPNKPTMVVVTGRAPHVRAQMWWRLEEPLTNPAEWPALLKGMAAAMKGDSAVTNPARVMRLAGSIAWPVKGGRTTEVTSIAELNEPVRCHYSADRLARIFPPLNDAAASAKTELGEVHHSTNGLGFADKIDDGRENYMTRTICACVRELMVEKREYPTTQQLFDRAWPQYERKVDLTRPGRGAKEFMAKCEYAIHRAKACKIAGLGSVEEASEAERRKQQRQKEEAKPIADAPKLGPVANNEPDPIDVGDLTGEPKEREWIVKEWIPKGVVSILSGDGGMGKTLLAQQLLYAVGVDGGKWLGIDVPAIRGLGVFCEDEEDELHRRHNAIKADLGYATGNPFTHTWVWPRVGFDNLLVTFERDNKPTVSPFFAAIIKHVLEKQIGLLILDTAADLFGGNEIIRAQVNYFIKATCGGFIKTAREAGFSLTVLLLSHPSQAGRNSGSGESGSTAWNNAVRARLYLTRSEDGLPKQRILTRKKSNYSASGDDVKLDLI